MKVKPNVMSEWLDRLTARGRRYPAGTREVARQYVDIGGHGCKRGRLLHPD